MKTRGRDSAASLAVVTPSGDAVVPRPKPPNELTQEQAEEWRAVVNRMPADWFQRETHALLAQYCRHVVAARHVAQMIASLEETVANDDDPEAAFAAVKAMDRLLKMQEREGRAMSSLATRMRLTQQTTYDKSKKKPPTTRKPWED